MSENRCPNCDLLNLPAAQVCLQCKTSLAVSSPPTNVNISTPTGDYYRPMVDHSQPTHPTPPMSFGPPVTQISKIGQRTHFWYRIFCSVIVIPAVVIMIFGLLAIIGSYGENVEDPGGAFAGGVLFVLIGLPVSFLYILGVVLPTKPFHWFFGIFLLVLGVLSCVLSPAAIPLLIFWVKPETRAYFERK